MHELWTLTECMLYVKLAYNELKNILLLQCKLVSLYEKLFRNA